MTKEILHDKKSFKNKITRHNKILHDKYISKNKLHDKIINLHDKSIFTRQKTL